MNDIVIQELDNPFLFLFNKYAVEKKYMKNPTNEDNLNPDKLPKLTIPLLKGLTNIDKINPMKNILEIFLMSFFISLNNCFHSRRNLMYTIYG